jgi:periplasmic protein TonB
MKSLLILFFSLFALSSLAQTEHPPAVPPQTTEVKPIKQPEIVDFPDVEAEFPGGPEAMKKWIRDNIVYPPESLKKKEEGKVFVSFVVREDGSIKDVSIERGATENLDREAIRAIKKMPNWIPGEMKGKQVATKVRIPIAFTL